MKKIIYFLGSRSLWVMLGITGLIILVWFIGPLISIGEVRPLVSKTIRFAVCATIIVFGWLKLYFANIVNPDETLLY